MNGLVFAACNIPLSKSDQPVMRKFLQTQVKSGGAIPGGNQLQHFYLERSYRLIKKLKGQNISVIFDETPDF